MLGMCKHIIALDDDSPRVGRPAGDRPRFHRRPHQRLFRLRRQGPRPPWEQIEAEAGLSRDALIAAADVYAAADKTIGVYGMGLTQHVHGFENIASLVISCC